MKSGSSAEMHEGADAFDRFRKAMKTIIGVPKSAVVPVVGKRPATKKKATK
jgi:hypothetical protein